MKRLALLLIAALALLGAAPDDLPLTPAPGWVRSSSTEWRSALFPDDPGCIGVLSLSHLPGANLEEWKREVRASFAGAARGKLMQDEPTARGHKILGTARTRIGDQTCEAAHYWLACEATDGLYVLHGLATQPNFDRHWDDIRAMAASFHP